MNAIVMDLTVDYRVKNWFALISASATTDNAPKWKHYYYCHSMLYLYYRKFKFQNSQLLKLGVNYSGYNMAHAEPDTSSNHRRCDAVKDTL